MRTASGGGRVPSRNKNRRTLAYEAVSTSIEKVDSGWSLTAWKGFSTSRSYWSPPRPGPWPWGEVPKCCLRSSQEPGWMVHVIRPCNESKSACALAPGRGLAGELAGRSPGSPSGLGADFKASFFFSPSRSLPLSSRLSAGASPSAGRSEAALSTPSAPAVGPPDGPGARRATSRDDVFIRAIPTATSKHAAMAQRAQMRKPRFDLSMTCSFRCGEVKICFSAAARILSDRSGGASLPSTSRSA